MTKIPIVHQNRNFKLNVKVDTGANANILTFRTLKQMYPHIKTASDINEQAFVTKSKSILTGYTQNQIVQ